MHEPSCAAAKHGDVPLPIADRSNDLIEECWEAYIAMVLNSSGSIVFTVSATGFAVYDDAGGGFGEEDFGLHFGAEGPGNTGVFA